MGWIGLDSFVGGVGSLFEAAPVEMPKCKRVIGGEGPGIEWAEAHTPFGPFDRTLGFSAPSMNYAAKNIGERR